MKIGAHIFNLALAGALGCVSVPLHAAEPWPPTTIKPKHALRLERGDKQIVGYFINDGDACKLTLVISESSDRPDEVPTTKPSRVIVSVASGKSAKMDTIEAEPVRFSCESGAQSMSVTESSPRS